MSIEKKSNTKSQINNCLTDLIIKRREARREYKSHFSTCGRYRRFHNIFGSTSVICGVLAGSGFLVEIEAFNSIFNIVASFLSLSAACLTGLITFNRYLEKAGRHEQAGYKWERLRDDYQVLILKLHDDLTSEQFAPLLKVYENLCDKRNEIRLATETVPLSSFWRHEHIKDKTELEPEQN